MSGKLFGYRFATLKRDLINDIVETVKEHNDSYTWDRQCNDGPAITIFGDDAATWRIYEISVENEDILVIKATKPNGEELRCLSIFDVFVDDLMGIIDCLYSYKSKNLEI